MKITIPEWMNKDMENNPGHWAAHDEIMNNALRPKVSKKPDIICVGSRVYARCPDCQRMIWNKPIFGTIHVCE